MAIYYMASSVTEQDEPAKSCPVSGSPNGRDGAILPRENLIFSWSR